MNNIIFILKSQLIIWCSGFLIFNISIASERQQGKPAKGNISDNLVAERGAFNFSTDYGEEIWEVPFVYSPNLMITIAELVD